MCNYAEINHYHTISLEFKLNKNYPTENKDTNVMCNFYHKVHKGGTKNTKKLCDLCENLCDLCGLR